MRSHGHILLISCYELGHQPFHLASLLPRLQKAGYSPVAIDTSVEPLSDEAIAHARFIGVSVPMHTALRLGQQIAKRIRKINPSAHICFYGLYALLNAEHLLQESIDSAIGGEYEEPLSRLIEALERNDIVPPDGVRTRDNFSGPWIQRPSFQLPAHSQLPPLDRYARLERDGKAILAGYTETTHGCKHTCLHCPITPIYQGRFFAIPVEIVLADIRAQKALGAGHITFGDPDFFNGPTHALRVTEALHTQFPDMSFDATIKIEHILKHQNLLPKLRERGCAFIVSAVESLNDTVLQKLDKGHTASDVNEAFTIAEQSSIPLRPSLMPFSPWETLESYIALLNFFEKKRLIEHLDPVHFSIRLLIPPGSALLNTDDDGMWLRELDAEAYTYRWQHPDSRMDTLHQQVAELVEEAERIGSDSIETFFRIKALALAANNQNMSVSSSMKVYGSRKVLPHLTESWFC